MGKKPQHSNWLTGIYAGPTSVSRVVDGKPLLYRDTDITRLLRLKNGFPEVASLLIRGRDPKQDEIDDFKSKLKEYRQIPWQVAHLAASLCQRHNQVPLDALRTCVSLLSGYSSKRDAADEIADIEKGEVLLGQLPTLLGVIAHASGSWTSPPPDSQIDNAAAAYLRHCADLSIKERQGHVVTEAEACAIGWPTRLAQTHAGYVYTMATGRMPEPWITEIFDNILILYAEHGFAASTFAARVVASTRSDFHSAICAGIGAIKGYLHGGASERAAEMIRGRENEDSVEAYVANERFFSGFGHPVYKANDDPRVEIMHELILKYQNELIDNSNTVWGEGNNKDWIAIYRRLCECISRRNNSVRLRPNVESPIGLVLLMLGIETSLYPMIFAVSRASGWTAHIAEHHGMTRDRVIRPLALYEEPKS